MLNFVMRRFFLCVLSLLPVLSGCIASNLGAALDSVGKAVPVITQKEKEIPVVYKRGDDLYMECEVRYMRYAPHLVDFYGDPIHWPQRVRYTELSAAAKVPPPERYLICLNEQKPALVRARDFDFSQAVRLNREEARRYTLRHIPMRLNRGWHFLSADLLDANRGDIKELSDVPEYRTLGNKLRTPLVAAISWGVDVPLSWAGSLVTSAVIVPATVIYVLSGQKIH